MELRGAHREQPGEDRHEARRVQGEAPADAHRGDHDAGDRGPEDPRRVEEARVEGDRVLQLGRADHPVGQGLARGRIEDEQRSVQRRDHVDVPRLGDPGERERGDQARERHLRGLRPDHRPPRVEPVDDDACEEAEDREREELRDGEDADGDRRVRELDHEPALREALHPRPGLRDDLTGEEVAVVAVVAEAGERAPERSAHRAIPPMSGGGGGLPGGTGRFPRANTRKKGARGGNMGSPTGASPRRATVTVVRPRPAGG